MRILHVITSLKIGGAEKLMVDLLPCLRAAGHDVELLLFDGVRTPFLGQLEASGIKIYKLGVDNRIYDIRHIWRLRKYLSGYDVIHTHNTACQFFTAAAKALFGGKAYLVTTEHSTQNRRRSIPLFRIFDSWMYRRYEQIICISEKAAVALLQYLGPDFPIRTVPNGIDISHYGSAEPLDRTFVAASLSLYCRILMQVAAFRPEKDQKTLIRALASLPETYHAVFVGDGNCRAECVELAVRLRISERIHFLGIRSDVPRLLKTADIVVMSSHWEGFGLAAVEGMAAGKPLIASDVAGMREVVAGAGVLFEPGNAKQLAEKIEQLMADPDYYQTVAVRCRDRAKDYDISKMVDSYLCVYMEVVNRL